LGAVRRADLIHILHNLTAELRRLGTDLPRTWQRHGQLAGRLAVMSIVAAALSFALSAWYLASLVSDLPDADAIANIGDMDQATTVYDSQDKLAFTIFTERRMEVPLSDVSPHLVQAILAIEDQRFYQHRGFDFIRTVGAALANVRNLGVVQGGSTITQQLARQSFLDADRTIRRKLKELILASRIEARYPKAHILELYLNKVYFGDGLYGVEAASRGFFGKSASELSLPEAALLAGLVKAPSRYAPTVNLDLAVSRRNVVLQVMRDTGVIDEAAWKSATESKAELADNLRAEDSHGEYFKEQVRLELIERFGWERVHQGGLRVFTTIDLAMQQAAEVATAEALQALDKRREELAARRRAAQKRTAEEPEPLQAALVAMDPVTGHVRAMIGGRDFGESRFNRAFQARRQPGSAFKPFVYAAALEAGYTPATVISQLNDPIATPQGDWVPADGHSTADEMTLRTGLSTSSNRAAVRLLQEVGIPRAVQYAQTLGVGDVPSVPSLALGSGEVTLAAMTAAYAAFANRGNVPTPIVVRRVEDRSGRVLYETKEVSVRAISERTAFLMANMLADVIDAGTAHRARRMGFALPAAGKTGTTNDFHDAWFVGFTPKLVAGVWVGFDQPQTILPNGFASDIAVPLWTSFMKEATSKDRAGWFRTPAEVTTARVCRISGKLAADGCGHVEQISEQGEVEQRSMIYTEYFVQGTEPTEVCHLHARRGFFGTVADVFLGRPPDDAQARAAEPGNPPELAAVEADAGEAVDELAPAAEEEEPKEEKKRGFWGRLFGIGGDD
jgi:penicillin-binding protein 1A